MTVTAFVDANVLLYAASRSPTERRKKRLATAVLSREEYGLSTQVLQEFYVNATAKHGVPPADVVQMLTRLAELPCVVTDVALVFEAALIAGRHKISYWDAAIVAAAERLGVRTLYTEDLSDGQTYGTVTVANPFREA